MLRFPHITSGLMVGLLSVSLLPAQEQRPARQAEQKTDENKPKLSAEDSHLVDALAEWLKTGNQAEVELGQLASQKATSSQVKEFARMMVESHKAYITKLEKFTKDKTPSVADIERDAPDQQAKKPAQERPEGERIVARRPGFEGDKHATMQQIGKRAGELKIQMTKELLNEYQGQEFDMAYMGEQIAAHISMLANLKAIEKHTTGEFSKVVQEGVKATEDHLKKAKQISNQLQQKPGRPAKNR